MKNTDTSSAGKGMLSTMRGKITATILALLALNAAGLIWIALTAGSAIPPLSWGVAAGILLLTVVVGAAAGRILQREARQAVADLSAVFQNIQGQDADLSCTMEDLDNPDLKHISSCYNSFLASVRELVEKIRKMGIDIALDSTRMAKSVFDTRNKTAS